MLSLFSSIPSTSVNKHLELQYERLKQQPYHVVLETAISILCLVHQQLVIVAETLSFTFRQGEQRMLLDVFHVLPDELVKYVAYRL